MAVDLSVFGKLKTKQDFDREAQAWELDRAMKQAQLNKLAAPPEIDVDKLGEQAFMKAAMGAELTPQEQAAARFLDAKSGGVMIDPYSGNIVQKPRLSDRIGIGSVQNPQERIAQQGGQSFGIAPVLDVQMENIPAIDDGSMNFPSIPQGAAPRTAPPQKLTQQQDAALKARGDVFNTDAPSLPQSNVPQIGDQERAVRKIISENPFYSDRNAKGAEEARKLIAEAKINDAKASSAIEKEARKPMPASVLTLQNKIIGEASGAGNVIGSTQKYIDMIDSGKLDLGLFSNMASQGRNAIGYSNETSRNFNSFKTDLEKMRNDSLRLNSGVQTDGDAQRAWNELVANLNDPLVVRQRLEEINGYNQAALAIKQGQLEDIRTQYGKEPLDLNISGQQQPNVQIQKNIPETKMDIDETLFNARKALKKGANQEAIRQRLIDAGIDPAKAGL